MESTLSVMGIVFAVAMGGIFGALVFIAVELSRVASAFVVRPREAQRDPEADDLLRAVLAKHNDSTPEEWNDMLSLIKQHLLRSDGKQ